MAKVFISHRGADEREAEQLATDLKTAGHQVRLDLWDLNVGDSVIAWMNQGIQDSKYLILCYSSSGVLAPWISREWMSALALQLEGSNIRLLPVRLTGGSPPKILSDI